MRLEGWDKVSGRARYASDMRLPGVHAALSSFDAPEIAWYGTSRLFDRTVRLVGDEVAAVAAENEDIARDALRLVAVDYEPLPFDAMRGVPEKPQVEGRGDIAAGMASGW